MYVLGGVLLIGISGMLIGVKCKRAYSELVTNRKAEIANDSF